MNTIAQNRFLYSIQPGEFLDSPEWESVAGVKFKHLQTLNEFSAQPGNQIVFKNTKTDLNDRFRTTTPIDEKQILFNVTLIATTQCQILSWNIRELEQHLSRNKNLAKIFQSIIGRDITNKLYTINEKIIVDRFSMMDIRLPMLINLMTKPRESIDYNHRDNHHLYQNYRNHLKENPKSNISKHQFDGDAFVDAETITNHSLDEEKSSSSSSESY